MFVPFRRSGNVTTVTPWHGTWEVSLYCLHCNTKETPSIATAQTTQTLVVLTVAFEPVCTSQGKGPRRSHFCRCRVWGLILRKCFLRNKKKHFPNFFICFRNNIELSFGYFLKAIHRFPRSRFWSPLGTKIQYYTFITKRMLQGSVIGKV